MPKLFKTYSPPKETWVYPNVKDSFWEAAENLSPIGSPLFKKVDETITSHVVWQAPWRKRCTDILDQLWGWEWRKENFPNQRLGSNRRHTPIRLSYLVPLAFPEVSKRLNVVWEKMDIRYTRLYYLTRQHQELEALLSHWGSRAYTFLVIWGEFAPTFGDVGYLTLFLLFDETNAMGIILEEKDHITLRLLMAVMTAPKSSGKSICAIPLRFFSYGEPLRLHHWGHPSLLTIIGAFLIVKGRRFALATLYLALYMY